MKHVSYSPRRNQGKWSQCCHCTKINCSHVAIMSVKLEHNDVVVVVVLVMVLCCFVGGFGVGNSVVVVVVVVLVVVIAVVTGCATVFLEN